MDAITRVIQKKLGMTLEQFCEKHLNCERQAFSVRLRKGKLYPNEYLYISLITETPIKELFGSSFEDTFIFRGDPEVSERLKKVISIVNDPERLTQLLSAEITVAISQQQGHVQVPIPETPQPVLVEVKPEPVAKAPDTAPVDEKEEEPFVFEDTFN